MGAILVLLLTAVGPPNLCADIINGDFSAGNSGFSSNYTYVAPAVTPASASNPVGMWAEGTYTVDTDPNKNHSSWDSFRDHTTGTGNMLIANGATIAGLNVWMGTNSPPILSPGTYLFSAWVASAYPANPAVLDFKVNGIQVGSTFTASSTPGDWQPFTATFSTGGGSPAFSSIDVNIVANGNDFALDDIHLQQVPDGGVTLMLLGGALVGLETLRRKLRA